MHTKILFKEKPVNKIRQISNPSSKRMTSEQPGWFGGTLRHWACWRRVFLFFSMQHNGVFGRSSFFPISKLLKAVGDKKYLSLVQRQHLTPPNDFTRSHCSPSLIAHTPSYSNPELEHWQKPPPSFQMFLGDW